MKSLLTLIMTFVFVSAGMTQTEEESQNFINDDAQKLGEQIELQIAKIDEELDMIDKRIGKDRKKMTDEVYDNMEGLKENRMELEQKLNVVAHASEEKVEKLMEDMNGWLKEVDEDTQELIYNIRAEIDKATM